MNLTIRILIGMFAGLLLGVAVQAAGLGAEHFVNRVLIGDVLDAGGQLFVASLKVMVVPLVFVSLVCGAASLGQTGSVGRLGGKTLGLYLLTTAIAVTLALAVALVIDPGEGAQAPPTESTFTPKEAPSVKDTIINIFPTNPVAAMAEGKMLQIIVFALLFGIAISKAAAHGQRVLSWFSDVNEVLMQLITMLIKLAPYGVFCLMAKLFATVGAAEILRVGLYFLTVVLVLFLQVLVVYPTLLTLFARLNPITFLKKMREPQLVAFSTSSSGATLPVTLRTVHERVGVRNEVASFAVPLGATINMDGTAIMQGCATVFIAQFYGIPLEVSDLVAVVLTATLASIGTAAVPGVGLVTLTLVLGQVGLPVEGIILIIGVDRLLDMLRTVVNITGDGTVSTIVARSEGQLDLDVFEDPDAGRVIDVDGDETSAAAGDSAELRG
ncbi:MAG: dicarboxylate/amino acid:cation symporter [Pseudomonadota bacterium]